MIDIWTFRKVDEREREPALFPRSLEGGGSDVIELTPAQPGGEPKYFKSIKKLEKNMQRVFIDFKS